ncbi:hypothetical protein JCM8547_006184 [Rhodosporidiobolus lusitaniae]
MADVGLSSSPPPPLTLSGRHRYPFKGEPLFPFTPVKAVDLSAGGATPSTLATATLGTVASKVDDVAPLAGEVSSPKL